MSILFGISIANFYIFRWMYKSGNGSAIVKKVGQDFYNTILLLKSQAEARRYVILTEGNQFVLCRSGSRCVTLFGFVLQSIDGLDKVYVYTTRKAMTVHSRTLEHTQSTSHNTRALLWRLFSKSTRIILVFCRP